MAKRHGRTDGRTDGRSKARANGAALTQRSLPDDKGKGQAILAMLKQHGGVMKPGELAAALKLKSTGTLAYQLKPLVRSKQVVITGATAGRRVSLPGARAAKEVP